MHKFPNRIKSFTLYRFTKKNDQSWVFLLNTKTSWQSLICVHFKYLHFPHLLSTIVQDHELFSAECYRHLAPQL